MSKMMVRISDLNDEFGWTAHDEHLRRVREAAPPLSYEQKVFLRNVLLDHLREREAKRRARSPRSSRPRVRVHTPIESLSTDDSNSYS